MKFYTSVVKGLKLKVRKFLGLIRTFVEVAGKKLAGRPFSSPIMIRVNQALNKYVSIFPAIILYTSPLNVSTDSSNCLSDLNEPFNRTNLDKDSTYLKLKEYILIDDK